MHEAIRVADVARQDIAVHQRHVSGPTKVTSSRVVRRAVWRQEPASVSNPIRADGTRAPSPYYIDSFVLSCGNTAVETSGTAWGWFVNPVSQSDAWTDLLGGYANLEDAMPHVWLALLDSNAQWRADDTARTNFLNKLLDHANVAQMELGVASGEFRQSVGTAGDLASGLVNTTLALAKSVRQSPATIARTLSTYGELGPKAAAKQLGGSTVALDRVVQGYLTWQFGVKPLVQDLVDGTALINRKIVDGTFPEQFTARIRSGAEVQFDRTVSLASSGQNGYPWGVRTYGLFEGTAEAHISAIYRIPTRVSAFATAGFDDSLSVAWELCRYSWLVDYLLKVGPWLRSLQAGKYCDFVEGTMSTKCESTLRKRYSESYIPGVEILRDPADLPAFVQAMRFKRQVLSGVRPAFLPSLGDTLKTTQLANALSAITTTLGVRARADVPVIKY